MAQCEAKWENACEWGDGSPTLHRDVLIARCRDKVAARATTGESSAELPHGVSVFLEQLIKTLRVEQGPDPAGSMRVSGPATGIPTRSEIGEDASLHGGELMQSGFSIESVVHHYGDLCQAITDLACETDEPVTIEEFRTLNRCLDNAIATAVTEFTYTRDRVTTEATADALNERLGSFAHELRNSLSTATLAVRLLRGGGIALNGATAGVLDRSLVQMRNLIDRSLAEARLASGPVVDGAVFSLAGFIAEIRAAASLEADVRGRCLIVPGVDPALALAGDRDLLLGAVGNLLHNAFKFSPEGGEVILSAYGDGDRILIEVADSCGGLADGVAEAMFKPFAQMGTDRTGVGLGLSIARRSVEANSGTLTVRNSSGHGCVLTIAIPRHRRAAAPDVSPAIASMA